MKCVTPMFRVYQEYTLEEKKMLKAEGIKQFNKIIPRKQAMMTLCDSPNHIRSLDELNEKLKASGSPIRWGTVPCKNCYACKLNQSAEWATRIMCECTQSNHNYFVTLTYDDAHLPILEKIELGEETFENVGDEIWGEGSVYEPHMKKFIHDLRQHLERHKNHKGMQYYYCAEYGENTHRPHYHIILLNCPLDLSQFYDTFEDDNHKEHWKSHELEHYWPHGMIDIATVEWSNAAYVARYTMKKLHDYTKSDRDYALEGKLKEFVHMSRKIGRSYYETNKDHLYDIDAIVMKTVKGNTGNQRLPKAWDRLMEKENPEYMEAIRQSRQEIAKRSAELERRLTDMTDLQMLMLKAKQVEIKAKQLPRVGEW